MGFNTGTIANNLYKKKLAHDRDIEFALDPIDIDETNLVLEVANIQNVFEEEQAIPEKDSTDTLSYMQKLKLMLVMELLLITQF